DEQRCGGDRDRGGDAPLMPGHGDLARPVDEPGDAQRHERDEQEKADDADHCCGSTESAAISASRRFFTARSASRPRMAAASQWAAANFAASGSFAPSSSAAARSLRFNRSSMRATTAPGLVPSTSPTGRTSTRREALAKSRAK